MDSKTTWIITTLVITEMISLTTAILIPELDTLKIHFLSRVVRHFTSFLKGFVYYFLEMRSNQKKYSSY